MAHVFGGGGASNFFSEESQTEPRLVRWRALAARYKVSFPSGVCVSLILDTRSPIWLCSPLPLDATNGD